MKNKLKKLAEKLRSLFLRYKSARINRAIYQRQLILSRDLDQKFNSVVKYGLFKGFKLSTSTWWAKRERGAMLLGLYEIEVLESLKKIPPTYTTFIDLGAADGYYGVGVLVGNLFQNSICYEISELGRQTIKENASLNGVSNRIQIRGTADKDFYKGIDQNTLNNSVLLIDIEGAEFDLVHKETFAAFKNSVIIIELHEWNLADASMELEKLKNDSQSTHVITEFRTSHRDPAAFSELKKYSDTDRWLICSEGRPEVMRWWRFDPK